MKKQWVVYCEPDYYWFDQYEEALNEYEFLKEDLDEKGTQIYLLETKKVATSVIGWDEEDYSEKGVGKWTDG